MITVLGFVWNTIDHTHNKCSRHILHMNDCRNCVIRKNPEVMLTRLRKNPEVMLTRLFVSNFYCSGQNGNGWLAIWVFV